MILMEKNIVNKKHILMIIASIVLVIIGSTVAWFTWRSEEDTKLVVSIGDIADVIYDDGDDITASNIGPVLDYNDGEITTFSFKKRTNSSVDISVFITPSQLSTPLQTESFKIRLMKSTDSENYNLVNEINFSDKVAGTKYLLANDSITTFNTYYKVIIYIDGKMENSTAIMGNTFEGVISVESVE